MLFRGIEDGASLGVAFLAGDAIERDAKERGDAIGEREGELRRCRRERGGAEEMLSNRERELRRR